MSGVRSRKRRSGHQLIEVSQRPGQRGTAIFAVFEKLYGVRRLVAALGFLEAGAGDSWHRATSHQNPKAATSRRTPDASFSRFLAKPPRPPGTYGLRITTWLWGRTLWR